MKTPVCSSTEGGRIALGEEAQRRIHARCPGWWKDPAGKKHRCDCKCHGDGAPPPDDESALVTLEEPVRPSHPRKANPASKKAGKRPPGGRRCECCGELCNGRFLPGHDAKLKGILTRAAHAGDPAAWTEILVRQWSHVVSASKVSPQTRAEGRRRYDAMDGPGQEAFLRERISSRASL